MLEEQVGHNVDHIPRRVLSPAVGAPVPGGSMPAGAGGLTSRMMEPQRHTASPAQHPGQLYRPHIDEVLNQLQSQLHVHSDILEEQRHKLDRLDHAVTRLQQDQNMVFSTIRDIQNSVAAKLSASGDAPDATEIDILMEQLRNVTVKVNEVEGLKLELNIMRRQMRRLERHASPVLPSALPSEPSQHDHAHPAPQPHAHHGHPGFATGTPSAPTEPRPTSYQTPQENRLPPPILSNPESRDGHAPTEGRTLPSFRSIDPASTSAVSGWRPAGGFPPGLAPAAGQPTATPQAEAPPVSGWAAVNAVAPPKRAVPLEGQPTGYEPGAPGSPKRQRLAPLMPRVTYGEAGQGGAPPYEGAPEVNQSVLPAVPSLANSRQESNESAASLPAPPNQLRFVLSTQDAPAGEDTWRAADAHRALAEAGRGGRASPRRGRGGGRGRGRKSGGGEERGTPEWDQPADWAGGPVGTNGGFYPPGLHHQDSTSSRGSLVRRGGGHAGATPDHASMGPGAAPLGVPQSSEAHHHQQQQQQQQQHQQHQQGQHMPHASLYPDPHFMPISTSADIAAAANAASTIPGAGGSGSNPNTPSQASTKKTRTKPIRNADGVLIRKDGRPDMRSVSSAMNLKKVHAKKEAERHSKDASEDARDTKSSGGANDTPRSNNDPASPNETPSRGKRADQQHEYASSDEEMDDEEGTGDEASDDEGHGQPRSTFAKALSHTSDKQHMRNSGLAAAFFPPAGGAVLPPPDVKIEADGAMGRTRHAAISEASSSIPDGDRAVPSRESRGPAAVAGAGEKVTGDVGVGPAVGTPAPAPVPAMSSQPASGTAAATASTTLDATGRPSLPAVASLPTPVPSAKPDIGVLSGTAASAGRLAPVAPMGGASQDVEMGEAGAVVDGRGP